MTAPHIIDPAGLLGEALSQASPDLMRSLLQHVINALLSADADTVCGAQWGQQDPQRQTRRNGYRYRPLDTRVGTIDVAIPKLRSGTYFPEWLLQRRKRSESALITVVADCYLAGVSTRRMDKLVKTLGITGLSKSQVSRMASDLDEHVDEFRHRPLDDAGPFTFVAADALTMKVREGGRVVSCAVLVATGVNNDGHREVLGVRVSTSETGPAWKEFFADLVARGLTGVRLVTSDAHLGRACQFFCVWGLEVGGDSVGVGGGELGEGLFPVGGGASLDEACGGCSFVGGFAGVCEALGGSFVFDVADGEP